MLLGLFMALEVADLFVTEALLHTGQAVEINPWMTTEGARLYAKPTVGLGLCAAILVLPPKVKIPAALAAIAAAAAPLLFLGIQIILGS